MKTVTYSVPAMHCGHCKHTVQTEIAELAGVSDVTASLETGQVVINFDDPATEEQIMALMTEINYPPVIV